MQNIVARLFLYIWKLLQNCMCGYYPPASNGKKSNVKPNYIDVAKLSLFCSGEPRSPFVLCANIKQAVGAIISRPQVKTENLCCIQFLYMSQSYCYLVGENLVLPPVCVAHDCMLCVQIRIHGVDYIKYICININNHQVGG